MSLALALLLCALGAAPSGAAPSCRLAASDYAALSRVKKKPLSRADVAALSGKDAENLCKARAFVRKLEKLSGKRKGRLSDAENDRLAEKFKDDELPTGMMRFIDADEAELSMPVAAVMLARMFSGKIAVPTTPLPPPPDCPVTALTDADYESLAKVQPPLTREAIGALAPKEQQRVCLGRRLLRLARENDEAANAKLTLSDVPERLSELLTAEEYAQTRKLESKIMAADQAKAASERR